MITTRMVYELMVNPRVRWCRRAWGRMRARAVRRLWIESPWVDLGESGGG